MSIKRWYLALTDDVPAFDKPIALQTTTGFKDTECRLYHISYDKSID